MDWGLGMIEDQCGRGEEAKGSLVMAKAEEEPDKWI